MNDDIQPIIDRWRRKTKKRIRKIVGEDGKEKIQLLVHIDTFEGILRFCCDGRPDGARPEGFESYLDYYEHQFEKHIEGGNPSATFLLPHHAAEVLFQEGMMYYHRYILLYQMGDYGRVVRDTLRNMRLFRFVHEHAEEPEDREHLERWWPYIIRIHYTARAMIELQEHGLAGALRAVREGIERIGTLTEPSVDPDTFYEERERAIETLNQLEKRILDLSETDEVELLRIELDEAVKREDYEFAAEIRDQIRALEKRRRG